MSTSSEDNSTTVAESPVATSRAWVSVEPHPVPNSWQPRRLARSAAGRHPRAAAADGKDAQQVVPLARDARLDDVRGEVLGALVERGHLLRGGHATAVRRQPRAEHVRHQSQLRLLTDRARAAALGPDVRRRADQLGVRVECHQSELPDLGFAPSASVELVVAAHTIDDVDDIARLLRQVHRVLRPDATFVVALTHPVAAMFDAGAPAPVRKYGSMPSRSLSELFMAFERTNFHIEMMHELSLIHI